MNEKITLRNLSTEKAFSKNVGPHVSMKNPGPRAYCPLCNNTILNWKFQNLINFLFGPQFKYFILIIG